ncbi:MAG: methyltransferase type 11 [Acidimicrobiia bacterium]|nr:MAG: methyltransferase type 11 [Acidimicrobiia bacterium]
MRATSFGDDAVRYDRARPGYPAGLVDHLVALGPGPVLDVGCGTGRVSLLLRDRGRSVLGVEADPRMAMIASSRGIPVEISSFESWDPRGRRFGLVVSGQAWHWVDARAGARKAWSVLLDGGALCVFWNRPCLAPEVAARMRELYRRVAPDLSGSPALGGVARGRLDTQVRHLVEAFGGVDYREFWWASSYGRDQYLDLLATYSDHHLYPGRDRLLREVGTLIDSMGGELTVHYRTVTLTAFRHPTA